MMWHDDLNASSCAMHVTYHCTDGGAHAVEQRTAQYSPGFGELQWRGWNRLAPFGPPIDGLFPLSIRDSVGSTHQASKLANVDAPWKELWCKSDRSHASAKYTKKRSFSWICCGYNEQEYKKDEGVHQEYKKGRIRTEQKQRKANDGSFVPPLYPHLRRRLRLEGGRHRRSPAASSSMSMKDEKASRRTRLPPGCGEWELDAVPEQHQGAADAERADSDGALAGRTASEEAAADGDGRSFPFPNLDRVNRVNCLYRYNISWSDPSLELRTQVCPECNQDFPINFDRTWFDFDPFYIIYCEIN